MTKRKVVPIEDKHASLANDIIHASWELSIVECRIILLILSHLYSKDTLDSKLYYSCKVQDYADLLKLPYKSAFDTIKKGLKHLKRRVITLSEGNREIEWIQEWKIEDGKVSVMWSEAIIPYISNLNKKMPFTQLINKEIIPLDGVYAIRLFQLLAEDRGRKKRKKGEISLSVDFLRESWCLPVSYEEYKFLKSKVLLPAIKEIEEKGVVNVKLKEEKSGKKVENVVFEYEFLEKIESVVPF